MMLSLTPWGLVELLALLPLAFGLTFILTGSTVGYWPRLVWCTVLRWHAVTRYFWPVLTCPSCNAFWTGALVAWLAGRPWPQVVMAAVIHCGIVGALQAALGGNGLAAADDFNTILGIPEAAIEPAVPAPQVASAEEDEHARTTNQGSDGANR